MGCRLPAELSVFLTDREQQARLGRMADAAIRERFRWDRHLDAIETALRAVVRR
jgi:hypothetical protein